MTRPSVVDPAQAAERISELSAQVAYHNQRYHQLDDPEISDADFDLLVRELRELEEQFPDLADASHGQPAGRAPRRACCSRPSCTPCR